MEKVMEKLIKKLGIRNIEFSWQYRNIKTDEERVLFTLNVIQEYDIVPTATGMPKNAKKSEVLREDGNKIFVKSLNNMTCVEALKLYTKSIAFAPYPSEQLALAYANRSAVLFQLGLHWECVLDIDRALALNYPDNLKAKLYIRKTECLMILGDSTEESLKEAQHWLEKMSLKEPSQEKLRAKLNVLHRQTVYMKPHVQREAQIKESPLPVIVAQNNEIPCASDAITLRYNEQHGRHVVATRDICPGEVIAVEKPYSMMLTQENMLTHCSNCLRVCWANIPCNYCTYAMYCSEECKNAEWKKCHDVECGIFPCLVENDFLNLDFFSVRLAVLAVKEAGGIQQLKAMLQEVDKRTDPRTKGFSQDGKLHSDQYASIYSLVTNTEKRSVSDLFRRSFDTSFIIYFLATRTAMFGAKLSRDLAVLARNDDVTFIGGLIMRHQQIIPSNIHSVHEEQGLDHVKRGIAAMPFFSLFNHSCNPNILRHSRATHVVMYVTYPVKKGEQLLDSYGEHCALYTRDVRQRKLLKQYYFICDCIPCRENWPLYHELKSYNVNDQHLQVFARHVLCRAAQFYMICHLTGRAWATSDPRTKSYEARNASAQITATLVKKAEDRVKIQKALLKLNTYIDMATEDKVQDKPYVIEDLLMMVQVLHDYAPMPCLEMNNVTETLKRVYDLSGNRFEIPQMWKDQK